MRIDEPDRSFHCSKKICAAHSERINVVDFYAQVTGRMYSTALTELDGLEIRIPDPDQVPGPTSFLSPAAYLEYLKEQQPDYEHVATYTWCSHSNEPLKIVHKFKLQAGNGTDRAPVLIFPTYFHRKKWFRVNQSDAKVPLPYGWEGAQNSQRVVIARDEAEADSISRTGISAVAVSSVGIWASGYAKRFRGLDVVLIIDPGPAGTDYLETVKTDLGLLAASLRALPFDPEQAASLSAEGLQAILDEADDLFRPWPKPFCGLKSFDRIPKFDPQLMLPRSLRRYLVDQADEMQVPVSSVAAPALAGLSILVGRKIVIQPKRSNPSFRVAAPLWCIIVADSG
ncbi:MAG TPA: hypothetical protein VE954_34490, partial [Oligoflexus sp.]|uniref:hypothetical protein n=1 Tax=Oligoflexus sp. TaxID=1971216 RepID=UPI002D53C8A8